MQTKILLLIVLTLTLSACANPLNQVTANRYLAECHEAERSGRLDIAEQACYRALVNVDWGNLGDEQKSQNLYNLARIKTRIGKLNEAEDLLKQSIEIEKKISQEFSTKLGRRYIELATVFLLKTKIAQGEIKVDDFGLSQGENRINDGVILLQDMKVVANQFSGQERETIKNIFNIYAEQLEKQNQHEIAKELSNLSDRL